MRETQPHAEPGRGVGVVSLDLVCFCVNRAEDEQLGVCSPSQRGAGCLCSCLFCLAPITTDTTLHFLFQQGKNHPP